MPNFVKQASLYYAFKEKKENRPTSNCFAETLFRLAETLFASLKHYLPHWNTGLILNNGLMIQFILVMFSPIYI